MMEISAGKAFSEITAEKGKYHFFNPTPRELMREMSTDRPDKTESAYTVDAGHFQIESSLFDYTYDHNNPERTDTRVDNFKLTTLNLKAGLLNNMDLQIVIDPYIREHSKSEGEVESKEGSGNIMGRMKVNVWGNDGGTTALAVMPFVKFPTNSNELDSDAFEGGVIFPLAIALPADWGMGLMTEFDFNRNAEKDYYTDFINTLTLGHQIIGGLDGYVEFFSSFNNEPSSEWVGTVDLGLTYAVSQDIQFDGGLNIGVTRSADDFNPFVGLTTRY